MRQGKMMLRLSALAVATAALMGGTGLPAEAAGPAAAIDTVDGAESEWDVYIVEFASAPLATYNGARPGLARAPRAPNGRVDVRSPEAISYVSVLAREQSDVLAAASSAIGRAIRPIRPDFQFQHAFSGAAVYLSESEAKALATQPGIASVQRMQTYYTQTDAGPTLIGAPAIWEGIGTQAGARSRGEGIVIGVIDSGANPFSPSFSATAADDLVNGQPFVHSNPLGSGNFLGWCNPTNPNFLAGRDVCNDKLIGGWDFIDDVLTPGNPLFRAGAFEARGFEDENNHGTHTASTAAGNRRVVNFASVSNVEMSGVAPRANIIVYDTCYTTVAANGARTGPCLGASLLAAWNQVVADGVVDVVNYSISGGTSPWTDPVARAMLNATSAGVFVAAAAGNSGPGAATTSHVSPWVTTVGASTHNRVFGFNFTLTAPGTPPAQASVLLRPGAAPLPPPTLSGPVVVSPGFANGDNDGCAAYPANTFRRGDVGAIAVLSLNAATSQCGSGARRTNALAAGATAVIFVADTAIGLGASGTSYTTTAASWAPVQAYLTANDPGNALAAATITAQRRTDAQADVIAGLSSRGPGSIDVLKPDIAAPGVDILAAYSRWVTPIGQAPGSLNPSLAGNIGLLSGTSMATPHVAGAAALLKAINRGWTPGQIRSALMTTAAGGVVKENGATPSDPFDRGAGRVALAQAANAALLLDETQSNYLAANPATGGNPANLNVPSIAANACIGTCTFTRTFRGTRSSPVTWTASVTGVPGATVSPASFQAWGGNLATVSVSVDALQLPQGQYSFGELVLTPSVAGLPVAKLPIAIRPAAPDIDVAPLRVATTLATGQSTSTPITIRNVGNASINWTAATGAQVAPLIDTPDNTEGITTGFFAGATTPGGAYPADDFLVVGGSATLTRLSFNGFLSVVNTLPAVASRLSFQVYADAGGVPAGHPQQTPPTAFWACEVNGPAFPGVTFSGADGGRFSVNLTAAGCPVANLPEGRYWLTAFPRFAGNTSGPRWFWSGSPVRSGNNARFIAPPPSSLFGAPFNDWVDLTSAVGPGLGALSFRVEGTVSCGAPWLSVGPASGALGTSATGAASLTIDATGLSAGTIQGIACIASNDSDEAVVPVSVSLTVTNGATAPTIAATSTVSANRGASAVVTADVVAGALPLTAVSVDATSLGGAAAVAMVDDGSNGDAIAGDRRFSARLNIAANAVPGPYALPVVATDGTASATSNATVNVNPPTNPAVAGAASPSPVARGSLVVFTAGATPGASPVSTGLAVRANLTVIGGSATQSMFDDGTNGDATPGDGVFSFTAQIPPTQATGATAIPLTVVDTQGRTGTANLSFTVATPTNPTAALAASPTSVPVTTTTLLTVSVIPGNLPRSTGIAVVGNLSSIGGSATQAFFDDGTNGDVLARDLVFTFRATVPLATTPGAKSIPVTITDAEGRTVNPTPLSITVPTPTAPSLVVGASPPVVGQGFQVVFIATVTGGTNPASSGIAVSADLSSVGGAATQQLFDDGTNGDTTAGDGIYAFAYVVPVAQAVGARTIPITITDAQARTASANASLTVEDPTSVLFSDGFEPLPPPRR